MNRNKACSFLVMRTPGQRAEDLHHALHSDAANTDHEGGFPSASIALLRSAGLLTAPLGFEHGGEALGAAGDVERSLELFETLAAIGRGSLVVGRLYEGHVNALQLTDCFGTPEQRRRAAADAHQGHLFGVWNTEGADGLKLLPTPDGWKLDGGKTFASGAGHVSRAVVTAEVTKRDGSAGHDATLPGWQMLLLATDASRPRQDASFWKPLGMRATASHAVSFSGRAVGCDELLGAPGDYYREPLFSGGAMRFAAVQQGGVEAVFDETRRFLKALGRTGDTLQRVRLGEMAWRVESGRLWLQSAARLAPSHLAPPADAERCVAYARLMRSAIEALALQVLALSDRSVGARGLLHPQPFERLHRDLTHYLRQPGPDDALLQAGRHVLDDVRASNVLWN